MRLSAGISTPSNLGIAGSRSYPWRCLWRGFLQITRTTFLRFTILQLAQILLTDGLTFMTHEIFQRGGALRSFLAEGDPPLRQIVG